MRPGGQARRASTLGMYDRGATQPDRIHVELRTPLLRERPVSSGFGICHRILGSVPAFPPEVGTFPRERVRPNRSPLTPCLSAVCEHIRRREVLDTPTGRFLTHRLPPPTRSPGTTLTAASRALRILPLLPTTCTVSAMAAHEERLGRQSVPPRGDGWEDEWEGTAPNGARAVMDRSGPKLKTRHLCGRERDSLLPHGNVRSSGAECLRDSRRRRIRLLTRPKASKVRRKIHDLASLPGYSHIENVTTRVPHSLYARGRGLSTGSHEGDRRPNVTLGCDEARS